MAVEVAMASMRRVVAAAAALCLTGQGAAQAQQAPPQAPPPLEGRQGSQQAAQLGPRPFYLVDAMKDGPAKEALKAVVGHVAAHFTVEHTAGEYARDGVTTNTIEGVFSIFKRGMKGVYQHCGEKHLHRYLAEFDFRYNQRVAPGVNDTMRAERTLEGIKGKRLTYRLA
jgi:hypothetical protein